MVRGAEGRMGCEPHGYRAGVPRGLKVHADGSLGHVKKGANPDSLRHTSVSFDQDTLRSIARHADRSGVHFSAAVRELIEWGLEAAEAEATGGAR